MSDQWRERFLLVVVVITAIVFAAPVMAQEEPGEEPTAEEAAAEEERIAEALAAEPFKGEIVVTSRRREEKLQEVPVAVSVVSSDELEDIAAK